MGKSLKRKCIACNTMVNDKFASHTNDKCKKKFTGWIFYNKDGFQCDENGKYSFLDLIATISLAFVFLLY